VRKKVSDILAMVRARDGEDDATPVAGGRSRTRRSAIFADLAGVPPDELGRLVLQLQEEMAQAAKDLRFEEAARLRDEINELKRELRAAG